MDIEELRKKKIFIADNSNEALASIDEIISESERVIELGRNSKRILDDLDKEFESQTGLDSKDIAFLILAVALQCTRIYLVNNLLKIEKAGSKNVKEKNLKKLQNKILRQLDEEGCFDSSLYYAPLSQIISSTSVPYDTTTYNGGKDSLFGGANHRFSTLGHDPILGLIFGTTNILTNTITFAQAPFFIQTKHVSYDGNGKNPLIQNMNNSASTVEALSKVAERSTEDKKSIVAALIKQIIHIGTDLYTPCGICFPGMNLILSSAQIERITRQFGMGEFVKAAGSAGLAVLINGIISALHGLTYDDIKYYSQDIYEVKTRKIIMYSNLIASTSNVLWTGGNLILGNKTSIRNLDIGGLLVMMHRLNHDRKFIHEIKEEFIMSSFFDKIRGNILDVEPIEEMNWQGFL